MLHNNHLILYIPFISFLLVTVSSLCNSSITLTDPSGATIYNCTSCLPGSFINQTTGPVDYLLDPLNNASITSSILYYCPSCISNCDVCINETTCGTCQLIYYLNINSTCSLCESKYGTQCQSCNSTHCTQCKGITVLNYSTSILYI